jgi:trimeric autotransporter adhesin
MFMFGHIGQIRAKAAHIYPAWADYVFEGDYALMPLDAVQKYISRHGHLPGIPSAAEVAVDGIDIGAMQAKTLEKVEELTLYLLEMKAENEALRRELEVIRKEIAR